MTPVCTHNIDWRSGSIREKIEVRISASLKLKRQDFPFRYSWSESKFSCTSERMMATIICGFDGQHEVVPEIPQR